MLFRSAALAERGTHQLGTVLLAPRLSHRVFATVALLATTSLVLLLSFGEYPRKTHVSGWLVPERGIVRVFAPQAGIVTAISVQEGAEVRKGDPLLTLSAELESARRGATQAEIARRLTSQRDSLEKDRRALGRLGAQQERSLGQRLSALQAEQAKLDSEIAIQASQLAYAEKSAIRERGLQREGLASEQQAQAAEEGALDQRAKLRELERTRLTGDRDRLALEGELRDAPLKSASDLARIERDTEAVELQLAEVEARREIVVSAPEAGTVAAIQVEVGERPDLKVPLVSIVPSGSLLESPLFLPSRAIGFLRVGQRVLLRYQAYPYQKFGHQEGVVVGISRSAVNPGELPAQLAGLTSLVGTGEPVYRVRVRLARQTVVAYGATVPLQPGMQLDADVVIERRRLIEWMFEPLFTLTGSLGR
jgi:membrane fusion protein